LKRPWSRAELASVLLPLAVFLVLAVEVEVSPAGVFRWERRPARQLARHWNDDPVRKVRRVARRFDRGIGAAAVIVLVAAAVLAVRRPAAVVFVLLSLVVLALTPVLKELFGRAPPKPLGTGPSFPSGHAIGTMSVCAALAVIYWRSRLRWVVLAAGALVVLAIGAAVVADRGHWPSDVVAGWALALAWVMALRVVFWKPREAA
jgi:membrane-associated phospholipid phosphatase